MYAVLAEESLTGHLFQHWVNYERQSLSLSSFEFITITTPNNKLNCITLQIAGYLTLGVKNAYKGSRIGTLDGFDFITPS